MRFGGQVAQFSLSISILQGRPYPDVAEILSSIQREYRNVRQTRRILSIWTRR